MKQASLPPIPRVRLLSAAIAAMLGGLATDAAAQSTPAADAPQTIVVTGSRIPRASLEGPSAVTVISGEEITRQGYKNVFDALSNQVQNSGFTQGSDFGNTFTPSANAVSLRGLGPNHTLILLNGRRLADFPIAYEGTVNFTNLANIPASIVERIEILNGGASAVYGSDAVAGVINIILKKQTEGVDVNLKAGTTSRGGGGDRRVQVTGGLNNDKLHALFALEVSERDPLWSLDRDFMAVRSGTPSSVLARKNASTGLYTDLGNTCATIGDLFDHSVNAYTTKKGTYCASNKVTPTYWTTQTKNSSQNLFGSANYELTPDTTLFADVLFAQNATSNNTRAPAWTSASTANSYFLNANTNAYETWSRTFAPEEIGGADHFNREWNDQSLSLALGAKGLVPGTNWNYEAAYNASAYQSKSHQPRALASIDSFFLGPKLGVDSSGVAIYSPDPARLTTRLTPAEFDSIFGKTDSDDRTWTHTFSLVTNGDAFRLPAGPIKVSTVLEAGRQGFRDQPDARINQGVFNLATTSDVTAGSRMRYAAGVEANAPLAAQWTATVAGRYDRYEFAGRSDSKFTYNGGLEFRPTKTLLFRANSATSFRAPDMNYIYQARGTGYYSSTTDYYRCGAAGQSIDNCEFANVSPGANYVQYGSKDLKSEKGRSQGLGVVWSPSANFDVSADYWKVTINDLVTNLNADQLLRDEAACRLGTQDVNSPTCVDAIARITRYPADSLYRPGEIKEIRVNPINAAFQSTSGIDLSLRYALRTASFGSFVWKANYARVLTKRSRQFAGDAITDDLHALDNADWPDKLNLSTNWTLGAWSNTLFIQRYGKVPNAAQTDYLSPTTLVNISTAYRIDPRASVSLIVNNLFNQIKTDNSAGWPNYAVGNYSPAGRQGWVEFNYHFGG